MIRGRSRTKKDRRKNRLADIERIVREVALFTLDKKGEEVVVLDIRKVSDATDFFVMVSGSTDTQVRAIADHVIEMVREAEGLKPWHIEGYRSGTWVLLDYVDFVLHVFERDTREYYRLERLWGDAEEVEVGTEG